VTAPECGHWIDGHPCGSTDHVRPYAIGLRCPQHPPARLAGRPEPDDLVDPELTLDGLRRKAGIRIR
jgi:hypothetical protein